MSKTHHPRKLDQNIKRRALDLTSGAEYEYFLNGIFRFNISKLNEYITMYPEEFELVQIGVADYSHLILNKDLNPEYVESADLSRPILFAEIAPDRHGLTRIPEDYYSRGYNLIDGHHRLAKAKKYEVTTLPAYIVRMEQHISFMTEGFEAYVGYWNGKLKQMV